MVIMQIVTLCIKVYPIIANEPAEQRREAGEATAL